MVNHSKALKKIEIIQRANSRLLQEINTDPTYEALRPSVEEARKHFLYPSHRDDERLHALLCFVVSEDIDSAASKATMDRHTTSITSIRPQIVKVLLDTSDMWRGHEEFFRGKGIIPVNGKFRVPAKVLGLEPGGNFDVAYKNVVPELQPILDTALEFALIPKEVSKPIHMDKHLLAYMATQLMPMGSRSEIREKQARFNALSLKITVTERETFMQRSSKAIEEISQRIGITVPADLVQEATPGYKKPSADKNAAVSSKQAFERGGGGLNGLKLTAAEQAKQYHASDVADLRQRLMALQASGEITPIEGLVYLHMNGAPSFMDRTEKGTFEKYKKFLSSIGEVGKVCAKVTSLLYPSEAVDRKPGGSSRARSHQAP